MLNVQGHITLHNSEPSSTKKYVSHIHTYCWSCLPSFIPICQNCGRSFSPENFWPRSTNKPYTDFKPCLGGVGVEGVRKVGWGACGGEGNEADILKDFKNPSISTISSICITPNPLLERSGPNFNLVCNP